MFYEICYDRICGKIVQSPYDLGYQMSREDNSVASYFTYSKWWLDSTIDSDGPASPGKWVYDRVLWCEENGIKLAGIEDQTYILSEDGYDYKPIPGERIRTFEFRFRTNSDAVRFKLVWA